VKRIVFALPLVLAACGRSCGAPVEGVPADTREGGASVVPSVGSSAASAVPSGDPNSGRPSGGKRRPLDGRCAPRPPSADPGPTKAKGDQLLLPGEPVAKADECTKHADCRAYKHGRCVARAAAESHYHGRNFSIPAHNDCLYDECTSDEECRKDAAHEPRADLVCTCNADERHTCSFANCRADSDCPSPFPCGAMGYCHAASDACRTKADCKGRENCTYDWSVSHYVCREPELPLPG